MTLFEDQKVKIILDHHFFYYWFIFRDHQSSNKYYLSSKNMCCFSSKMMGTIIEQSSTNHYPKSWNINKNSSPVSSIIEKSPPISSLKKKNKIIKKTSTSRQKNINYQKHIKGSSKKLADECLLILFLSFDNRTDDFLTCFFKTTSRHPQSVVKKIRSKMHYFTITLWKYHGINCNAHLKLCGNCHRHRYLYVVNAMHELHEKC